MTRNLVVGGLLAAMMGAGFVFPVVMSRLEHDPQTPLSTGLIVLGCGLLAGGTVAVEVGLHRNRGPALPGGVRIAFAANMIVLAFFALELSDRLTRQEGRVVYWSTFLFPPSLVLFGGLLGAQSWAWRIARVSAAIAVLWFLAFTFLIPFASLQTDGVPVPWYGRAYMIVLSLAFAGVFATAYRALGQTGTLQYFGQRPSAEPDGKPTIPTPQ